MDESDDNLERGSQDSTTTKPTPKKLKQIKLAKKKTQNKIPHHPDTDYARGFQLRFDARIKLDKAMDEVDSKMAIVRKFKEFF